jgi:hypothetical protein
LIVGLWVGLAIGLVQACFGTTTMFAGGGGAPAWAETLIKILQIAITITLTPALIAIAIGLGKKAKA